MNGTVHRGLFLTSHVFLTSHLEEIKGYIKKYSAKALYITGHSMGGGIATLLTLLLLPLKAELDACTSRPNGLVLKAITFATPPTVSSELCEIFDRYPGISETYVNENDIISRLSYGNAMDLKALMNAAKEILKGDGNSNEKLRLLEKRHQEIKQSGLNPKVCFFFFF